MMQVDNLMKNFMRGTVQLILLAQEKQPDCDEPDL
jgi:hypothetical protein